MPESIDLTLSLSLVRAYDGNTEQKKLNVKDEEIEKWKFSLLTGTPEKAISINDKRSERLLDIVKQYSSSPMLHMSRDLHSFRIGLEHDSRGHR